MEIVVHSPSPHDISPKETKELARLIQANYLGIQVRGECHQRTGRGVTLHEVLTISISAAAWLGKEMLKDMAKKLMEIAVHWTRKRFDLRNRNRTVYISVRGPDGKVVTAVRLKKSAHEPEDCTAEAQRLEDQTKHGRTDDNSGLR